MIAMDEGDDEDDDEGGLDLTGLPLPVWLQTLGLQDVLD